MQDSFQNTIEVDKNKYLEALLKANKKNASAIANKYSSTQNDIKILYEYIIKPSLYEVGEMWEHNIITVAAEHIATSISEGIMNELYENIISETQSEKNVVLGCLENEHHQVGIKMIADVFEMYGWDTFFLGANTPLPDFIDYAKDNNPQIIALSLSIYSHIKLFENMIEQCHNAFPQIPIIIGGQAFSRGGVNIVNKYNYVKLFSDIDSLESYIKEIS